MGEEQSQGGILPSSSDDGHHDRSDARLAVRARKNGWDVSPEIAERVVKKLSEKVDKDELEVAAKEGTETVDNDKNQIAAAMALIKIAEMNQAADQYDDKNKRLDEGKDTERTTTTTTYKLEFDK